MAQKLSDEEKKKLEEERKVLDESAVSLRRKFELSSREVLAIWEQGRTAIKSPPDPTKILTFKGMFRTFEKFYSRFESLWDQLDEHYRSDPRFFPTKEDQHKYNSVRSAYFETFTNYEAIIEKEKGKPESPPSTALDRTVPLGDITITNDTSLQPVPLPTFDGQILEWPKYRDIFVSLVHENEKLSPIKKFHYLVRTLKGPALTVVSAFSLEERNYALAWEALRSNFENNRMLASSYLNKLLNFKPIQKSNTESLKKFLTEVSDHVAAFQKLTIPNKSDFILFHLAVRNLDPRTREQFEISNKGVEFPKFEDLAKFVRDRVLALQLAETPSESPSGSRHSDDKKGYNRNSAGYRSNALVTRDKNSSQDSSHSCYICSSTTAHNLSHCNKFKEASVEQRLQWIKNWPGCKNCLARHHRTETCTSKFHCRYCPDRHHSMLHKSDVSVGRSPSTNPTSSAGTSTHSATCIAGSSDTTLASSTHSKILLATAVVEIQDARGIFHHVRFVIDSASQNSFITTRMMNQLGLKSSFFKRTISGIGDTPFSGAKGVVDCVIRSRKEGAIPLKTTAVILDDITTYLPNCDLPFELYSRYLNFDLADPNFFKASRVDFLLGADLFAEIWTGNVHHINEGFPKVFSTIFGDVVLGGFSQQTADEHSTSLFTSMTLDDLHESLKRFWEIEEPCTLVPRNPDDDICEDHFKSTHYRNPNGQYVVRLPFKEPAPPELATSAETSRKMFYNLESKLAKNPQLRCDYTKFMQEYIDLGHMSPTNTTSKYVIPHHAVLKEDRNQTKLRVVFNASSATGAGSLNDYLMVGPKLQTNIGLILLNYRVHPVVFSVDIVKFFRGILVDSEDRAYQHIYWRSDPSYPLQTYDLNTVTYGQRCSPFLSIRVLHALKENEGHNFPLAAKILIDDVYVDDYLTGSDSIDSALELQSQLIGIMQRGGLSLSKWTSNSKKILENVDACSQDPVTIDMEDEPEPKIKLLGLQWDPNTDCFSYKINVPGPIYTKRAILSAVSKVYDPLGFLTPSVLVMKSFIQGIWKEGLHWDQRLSPDMQTEWNMLISELPNLSKASIPRFVGFEGDCKFQVVGFCDASEKGYCAALYLRTIVGDTIFTHLLTAKSKLAPVHTISIPRLELQAAYLLSHVYKGISPFLERLSSERLPPIFFSDNSTVIGWLNTPPYRLKTFVANRVSEIIDIIPIGSWRHVSSCDNPSDCGSRGILPSELIAHPLWWNGPPWLAHPEEKWPTPKFSVPKTLPDIKPICLVVTHQTAEVFLTWMSQFSSYRKLLRVVAVLARSLNKQNRTVSRMEPLSVVDMKYALVCCVKILQFYYFIKEAKDPLVKIKKLFGNLSPFLDKDGLWRVGGRLRHSKLSENQKYPILLPTNCHFVTILVDYYHQLFLHASPTIVQAMIQIRFWVPNLRRVVRKRTAKCLDCFKQNTEAKPPVMADLPAVRVQQNRCFSHVGIDFAGPFTMRDSLRRKAQTSKVYLCLFVCMQTKALHLEAVTQLSTNAFMAAFDRFISRRGLPSDVYSDSGTNFVGAANLLRHLYVWLREATTKEDIRRYALEREISWHFNPPFAPHFGGIWESGVRSVKRLMRLSAGDTPLTYEELSTLFARYEAILNSRPLCPVSSDPEDVEYLTPAHFMVGGNLLAYPEPSLLDCRENTLDRWQLVKRFHQHFWNKSHTEYLSTLQKRVKWTEDRPNLPVGDLVLLKNASQPVMQWPTARVIEIHPGDDGVVRVVTIRTATRQTYRRPVVQLIPLRPLNSPSYDS